MERQRYSSYLLRMWRVGPEPGDWRAMVENGSTGERHGFASPQEFCAWNRAQAKEMARGSAQLSKEGEER